MHNGSHFYNERKDRIIREKWSPELSGRDGDIGFALYICETNHKSYNDRSESSETIINMSIVKNYKSVRRTSLVIYYHKELCSLLCSVKDKINHNNGI